MRNKKGLICMALGLFLLIDSFILTGYNIWDADRAGSAAVMDFEALKALTPDLEALDLPEELIPNYILDPEMDMPVIQIDGRDYIGYLEIPALELDLPVMSEWSYPNLKISPCRFAGSVYLNNMVLCAHNYERHFGGLKNLTVGDAVRFTDAEGYVFDFSVAVLEQLEPYQGKEMASSEWDLTLFTCTLDGKHRVTVRCVRDEEMET